jgi:SAM-dependent methyltransferase
MRRFTSTLKNKIRTPLFVLAHPNKPKYECLVCGYAGPFRDKKNARKKFGNRLSTKCPSCSSMERQRFQCLLLDQILAGRDRTTLSILHFSPEPSLEPLYRKQFGAYLSADLFLPHVDRRVDVQDMPFEDRCFDVILISHVIQYVPDDRKALAEISRTLKPGGVALIPVPLQHEKTIERARPDPGLKMYHEPGLDYFDRYLPFFDKVELHDSRDYPDKYHLFREIVDANHFPLYMGGGRYGDIIPACFKLP